MDAKTLGTLAEKPEVQRRILGDYKGPYSLGVARIGNSNQKWGFRLRIEGDFRADTHTIMLEGEAVPVIITGGFRAPSATG